VYQIVNTLSLGPERGGSGEAEQVRNPLVQPIHLLNDLTEMIAPGG
jgi:hypothetical protein